MKTPYISDDCKITLYKQGAREYTKMSFPIHTGIYSEIETKGYVFHFNLSDQIIRAKGKGEDWYHPHEWLKRNRSNDWIYYSTGGYAGVFEATGEYYLPNLPYTSNSMLGGTPFDHEPVKELVTSWYTILQNISNLLVNPPEEVVLFFNRVLENTPEKLAAQAKKLFAINGGRVTVLPPDARHVDYNVIPLNIADGCLYKCKFCRIKSDKPFAEKTTKEIDLQLEQLQQLYGEDLVNYNGLFLGEHDALGVNAPLLLYSCKQAIDRLGLSSSHLKDCQVFLFGSVDSLLNARESLFNLLQKLPAHFYINIGLESADQDTLDQLGKPISAEKVRHAFARMQVINTQYNRIEITANFVMDEALPESHYPAFISLVRQSLERVKSKGCVYLSPLEFGNPSRSRLFTFNRFKVLSRLPTFLYIIQRL